MNCIRGFVLTIVLSYFLVGCDRKSEDCTQLLQYAEQTFKEIYLKYSAEGENLLLENYPFDSGYKATYLDKEEQQQINQFAYLWPYSGTLSAASALYEATENEEHLAIIDNKILLGLEEYFDTKRYPYGYASYINRAPISDRFYDDNVWIGIDFTDLYLSTQKDSYLKKAEVVWDFVYSGHDDKLNGGIYWVEQNKESKNTCSNAPAIVFALKLYKATDKKEYLEKGIAIYNWTKEQLQDPSDLLYYDNIKLDGTVEKTKYAYNSGQMLQAAALLYTITKEDQYLSEAKALAESCFNYFFHDFNDGENFFKILNKGNVWFSAVMSRGFVELYNIDQNPKYIDSLNKSLMHAWTNMRDETCLFGSDWEKDDNEEKKWLLTQAAMVEMYARFSNLEMK